MSPLRPQESHSSSTNIRRTGSCALAIAAEMSLAVAAAWPTGACCMACLDHEDNAAFHATDKLRSMLHRVEAEYFGKNLKAPWIVASSRR